MNARILITGLCLLLCPLALAGSPRIIGGQAARAGEYPFSAAITVRTKDSQIFCGGALYTSQWIITSAQCVQNAISFTIILGSVHLNKPDSNKMILSTSEYVLHPEFKPDTLSNDVGLIRLRQPIQLNEYLKSIDLLPLFKLDEGQEVFAIGWGQTSDDIGEESEVLNYVKLTTLSLEECSSMYGNQVNDKIVCVNGNLNEGICTGDMGTPLIEYYSRQLSMHVGIATFVSGLGCESTYPSGYTRTYPYAQWIRNVTAT